MCYVKDIKGSCSCRDGGGMRWWSNESIKKRFAKKKGGKSCVDCKGGLALLLFVFLC